MSGNEVYMPFNHEINQTNTNTIFDRLRGRAFHAPFRLEIFDPAGVRVAMGNVDVVFLPI
ncbi:MAG: hypothetical protein RIT07_1139 [Bacteroidota bacterium]